MGTNLGEQDKSEKVEVKWLHPDGKPNMDDDKNNEAANETPPENNEKGSSSSGASSFFASAWSAWGKVENIAKTAAYSAGPEDVENSQEAKLQVESDGSVKELPNER